MDGSAGSTAIAEEGAQEVAATAIGVKSNERPQKGSLKGKAGFCADATPTMTGRTKASSLSLPRIAAIYLGRRPRPQGNPFLTATAATKGQLGKLD